MMNRLFKDFSYDENQNLQNNSSDSNEQCSYKLLKNKQNNDANKALNDDAGNTQTEEKADNDDETLENSRIDDFNNNLCGKIQ